MIEIKDEFFNFNYYVKDDKLYYQDYKKEWKNFDKAREIVSIKDQTNVLTIDFPKYFIYYI